MTNTEQNIAATGWQAAKDRFAAASEAMARSGDNNDKECREQVAAWRAAASHPVSSTIELADMGG